MHCSLFLLFTLFVLSYSQSCLKSTGQPVPWWVILKVPPKIGKSGYAYYDSTIKTGKFIYYDQKVDLTTTPLTKTMLLINSQNLNHVAWNDQKPSGQTSSTSAHAKGFIGFSVSAAKGFFISHSIPKYPAFVGGKVNTTIAAAQNYYGQHIACFSLTIQQLDIIAQNLLITWPFVYQGIVQNTAKTQNLYKLSKSLFSTISFLHNKYDIKSAIGYTIKTIYKNNKLNGSIFQDGLTAYLSVSPLIAETWGRPLQHSWCSKGFEVLNVVNVNINGISWNQQDDHSKWVLARNQYACFGDMNRMPSQWKRGGAFFCHNSVDMVTALKSIIQSHDSC